MKSKFKIGDIVKTKKGNEGKIYKIKDIYYSEFVKDYACVIEGIGGGFYSEYLEIVENKVDLRTHIIDIPTDIFNEIEIGDRIIINNEESKRCFVLYVEEL